MTITAVDPADHLRNIRVLMPGGVCTDDPFQWCADDVVLDAVPVEMSRGYAAAARAAGDSVRLIELTGVGHMELIDPADPAWQAASDTLADLV